MLTIDGKTYGLSDADLAHRKGFINASEAPTIVAGTPEAQMKLWQEKTGAIEPEYLSANLAVQMGSYTEPLNIYWFEMITGMTVTGRQDVLWDGFLRATIDGKTVYQGKPCVVEAKHIGAFSKVDEAVQRYMPQIHIQMHLTECRQAILSILHGTQNYEWVHVEFDDDYWKHVYARLESFHACVLFNQPPHDLAPISGPTVSEFKPYDFTVNNEWCVHEGAWTDNQTAAKLFE